MLISAIVAVAENGVIGDGADIPWRLSSDLKFFKRTTLNHHVIMGRKTFLSMGRPLPKRTNIVLSRDPFFVGTGIIVARSLEEALELAQEHGETEVFIIGGGEIYRQAMPYIDKVYLTRVAAQPAGDVTFPHLDEGSWLRVSQEAHPADEKNDHPYTFEVYERRPEAR